MKMNEKYLVSLYCLWTNTISKHKYLGEKAIFIIFPFAK